MSRYVLLFLAALLFLAPRLLPAEDDGPPIAITSPDAATTFAFANIKRHALVWDKKKKILLAQVTFVDTDPSDLPQDDEHDFRIPGVTFDEAKGVFYAVSAQGEVIPVAHIKKGLITKTIEVLPNANVTIRYPHGNVTVTLEAISPDDPAMHARPPDTNPDDTHPMNLNSILH